MGWDGIDQTAGVVDTGVEAESDYLDDAYKDTPCLYSFWASQGL